MSFMEQGSKNSPVIIALHVLEAILWIGDFSFIFAGHIDGKSITSQGDYYEKYLFAFF